MKTTVIGISGGLGTGKTYLSGRIVQYLSKRDIPWEYFTLDSIRRTALWHSMLPNHIDFREKLSNTFDIALTDTFLNRVAFTKLVFENHTNLNTYRNIAFDYLYKDVRKHIKSNRINIFEWTYIEEEGYLNLLTVPLIHTNANIEDRLMRLKQEGDIQPDILNRINLECFKPKNLVVDSNVEIETLLESIGVLAHGDLQI